MRKTITIDFILWTFCQLSNEFKMVVDSRDYLDHISFTLYKQVKVANIGQCIMYNNNYIPVSMAVFSHYKVIEIANMWQELHIY